MAVFAEFFKTLVNLVTRLPANTIGAACMIMSMTAFIINDTLMKLVLSDVGLFQAITIRGLFAVMFLTGFCWSMGALKFESETLSVFKQPTVIVRSLCEAGATFFFLTALFHIPLVNVTAILQILPLTVTLAAALFLGEKVGWRRYLAIFIGFLGVMLIIKPGPDGFNVFAIYALISIVFLTVREIATRKMPTEIPTLLVSLITATAILLLGVVGSLFEEWRPVGLNEIGFLSFAACAVLIAYIFSVLAMRHGDVSFVAPFRYSILISALFLGYFVFSTLPDVWGTIGSIIVVGTGLFTFYREQKAKKKLAEG